MSSSKQKQIHPKDQAAHDPFAAMRFRDYRLFTIGRVLLFTGGQMQTVAIGWELYERTNSPMALGGVGLAQVLPMILLTFIAGHVADKYNRQRTTLLAIFMLALCSLGLGVISYSKGAIFLVYACLAFMGVARAFLKPASDALMWQLIPTHVFANAATWVSSSFQLASVIGPALGGFAIALFKSATPVYIVAAIACLLCFASVAAIKPQKTDFAKEPISLKSLAAGAEFVWNNQIILAAITLDLFAVLLGGAVALLPVYAKDILQVGPVELGYLQAAPSIGALIMAALLVYLPPIRKAGLALLWSVAGFGVVTIIFGLSRWVWLSLLMLALTGALDSISVVIRHTLVQIKTPDHLRGRVAAINSVFISASNELGGFESGAVAALFGPVFSVVSGGIGTILVVVVTAMIWPEIRKLGALHEDL
ncbi:MAG: MFS transporter [Sphaerospermopsis kisseleviana]|uniref:Major facilitator superfamily protein n=2 Tax=Sphaerospermopsis TaxID=752201 RepID=A0A480A0G1_9CYAN|nr:MULTISPECIES: MFS transporter [Sphaerospermopsis]BAZ83520.1 major facilitator superfamily protein [Sphaerospermopsis kisseleviana NIES-73]MBD2135369.1 MFS transporter [Sphaerospermopsis sp. FACHB-1094]MBD2148274.1 MFS transporter [Sphaerospermopsis sp. FACHB-1194]MDB9440050.1 MFS transporter [Sphaerospermopsis kisseleviana CS-549]GCL38480.1 major facilitator superfamily protein [Sphaerospermopsis reniformis]